VNIVDIRTHMVDVYFKKEISYIFEGKKLCFDVAETLFSTFDIDHGTDVFLRCIDPISTPKSVLDIGCGYGPIGISLASKFPEAEITMVDRDLLSVKYTRHNIKKNGIKNAVVIGSVGMEMLEDRQFDLIVSNIPAKIGDEAISEDFILLPYNHLSENGELWFVVVNALNRLIPKVASKYKLHITKVRDRKGHAVYKVIKKL